MSIETKDVPLPNPEDGNERPVVDGALAARLKRSVGRGATEACLQVCKDPDCFAARRQIEAGKLVCGKVIRTFSSGFPAAKLNELE